MVWEALNVLRDDKLDAFHTVLYVTNLENLSVVSQYIRGHLEGRHIDYVHIWVLSSENAADLGVFSLQELVHGDAFRFFNRQ